MRRSQLKYLAFGFCVLAAAPGVAQLAQQRSPVPPPGVAPPTGMQLGGQSQPFTVQEAVQQMYAMAVLTGQQIEARVREMQKRYDDLMAYAVACGDKPGCFVPLHAEPGVKN